MQRLAVVLAAAGRSSRFLAESGGVDDLLSRKPFIQLNGQPVWLYSARLMRAIDQVGPIVVLVPAGESEKFISCFAEELDSLEIEVVEGGQRRQDSVRLAIDWLARQLVSPSPPASGPVYVMVHDAARPCVTPSEVEAVCRAAFEFGAAILGCPVSSTVKRVLAGRVNGTIDRRELVLAQTPQVARLDWLQAAFEKFGTLDFTDEAQLLEHAGHPIAVVDGLPTNIKITTSSELAFAESILRQSIWRQS